MQFQHRTLSFSIYANSLLSHFCWYLLQILVKHSTLLRIKEPSLPTDFWDTDCNQVVPLKVGSAEPLVKPLLTQSRTIKLAFLSRCDIPTNPDGHLKRFNRKDRWMKKRETDFFQTDSAKKVFLSLLQRNKISWNLLGLEL